MDLTLTFSISPRLPNSLHWGGGKPHSKEIVTIFPRCRRAAWPGRFSGRADNLEDIKAGREGSAAVSRQGGGARAGISHGGEIQTGREPRQTATPRPGQPTLAMGNIWDGQKGMLGMGWETGKAPIVQFGSCRTWASAGMRMEVG